MRFLNCICAAVALAVVVMLAALPAMAQPVKLATGEWAPFVSKKMEGHGFTAEIVQHALLAAGIEPEMEFFPWARCEQSMQSGDAKAAFPYARTAEREGMYVYSEPIAVSRNVLFFLPEKMGQDFDFTSLETLKDYKIGGVRGNYYEKTFKEAGVTVDYASSAESSVKKLYLGRVDVMPENELVGWQLIKTTYPDEQDKFAATATAMDEQTLHLIAPKDDAEAKKIIEAFNKGLAAIKQDGVYESILKKYGLQQ